MGSRFQRGGGGQATIIAQPRTELLPGLDRPKAVLFLGGSLFVVNNTLFNGPIGQAFGAAFQPQNTVGQAAAAGIPAYGGGLLKMLLEAGLVGFLYMLATLSDEAGSVSVLLLIALWVVFLIVHANELNPSGAGKAATTTNTAASTAKK